MYKTLGQRIQRGRETRGIDQRTDRLSALCFCHYCKRWMTDKEYNTHKLVMGKP
jgi:hypothetical protein